MKAATMWDYRFLELAHMIGRWSKEPRSKVGAVIVRPDRTIVSTGYNGFPRGVIDSQDRFDNRELKNSMAVHAEQNAIVMAHESLNGCTIYVTPLLPCSQCAGVIIQSGIKRVVAQNVGSPQEWRDSAERSKVMFAESGVEFVSL